jgi:hypothetical protein
MAVEKMPEGSADSDPIAPGNSDNTGRWVQKTSLIQPIPNPVELVCTLPFASVEDACDGGCDEGTRCLG